MKEEYREAFSEIEQIINLMPANLSNKIPVGFRQIISTEKSKTYIPKISEPLEECHLKEETIIILAVIYRDFLCSKQEREKLIAKDKNKLLEFENELREKYSPDNLFKNRQNKVEQVGTENEEKSMILVQEQKWYQRIFNLIKRFFKR